MPFIDGPVYCPAHHIRRGDYIRQFYRNRGTPIPPEDLAQLADDPSNADTSNIVGVYIVMVGIDATVIASVDAIEIASVRY
jgi:hypothetical protein